RVRRRHGRPRRGLLGAARGALGHPHPGDAARRGQAGRLPAAARAARDGGRGAAEEGEGEGEADDDERKGEAQTDGEGEGARAHERDEEAGAQSRDEAPYTDDAEEDEALAASFAYVDPRPDGTERAALRWPPALSRWSDRACRDRARA